MFEPLDAPAVRLPSRAERLALRITQLGILASVAAVSTHKAFELDRFFIPKELALHATVFLGCLFAARAMRELRFSGVDRLLVLVLVLSAASALLATNPWLGFRAFAVSASAAGAFWLARGLRNAGLSHALLIAIALAIVTAAGTSLLQAYGLRTELFSLNRSPGGTLGNRNFIGHAAAYGLPVLLLLALRARGFVGYIGAAFGTAIVTAALVLTRSRAAWLASGTIAALFLIAVVISPALRTHGPTWRRLAGVALLAGTAVAAALLLPNALRWRSDNPYLESIVGVVDYEGGSGRGRLLQYERSLRMAAAHPLLGVGPGNWPVVYPAFAARGDPSMNGGEPGTTFNPWPSSDWVAFISERGFAAAALLAVFFASAFLSALHRIRSGDPDESLAAFALLGTIAGAGIAGSFDAVLLLGMPALIVWSAMGALWRADEPEGRRFSMLLIVPLILVSLAGAMRNAAQIAAMEIYTTQSSRSKLQTAAFFDPGNYKLRLRLAAMGNAEHRCRHALAARALFPNAEKARSLAKGCDD